MVAVDEGCENSVARDAVGLAAKSLFITFYDAS